MIRRLLSCLLLLTSTLSSTAQASFEWIYVPFPVYAPETEWAMTLSAIGSGRLAEDAPPSSVLLTAAWSQRSQKSLTLDSTFYQHADRQLVLRMMVEEWPEDYFGLGNDTDADQDEIWESRNLELSLTPLFRLRDHVWLGPVFDSRYYRIEEVVEGGLLASDAPTGIEGGRVIGIGAKAIWDSRDDVFAPERGSYVAVSVTGYDDSLGSQYDFQRYVLDARQFWPVTANTVLALSQYVSINRGDVPFQELSKLGNVASPARLRGYVTGRFRDRDSAVAQAEWRFPIHGRVSGVAFAGVGDVWQDIRCRHDADPKWTLGAGLRFRASKTERINLRLDVGVGEDESAVYFRLMEAF